MTQDGRAPGPERTQQALKMALVGVIGQVGCLALLIILGALVAGLWLDGQFHTRPLFTLILVLGSVPVTLFVMFRLVLTVAPKLQTQSSQRTAVQEKHEGDERAAD